MNNSFVRNIPNSITLLNLFCGAMACVAVLYLQDSSLAVWLVALAALFDLLDGMVARWLHATSPLGADLDSLSDVVSFGLVPALMIWHLLQTMAASMAISGVALLIVIAAAVRLARFNNDSRQHHYFIGLPVPANALFWIGIYRYCLSLPSPSNMNQADGRGTVIALLLGGVVVFSFLMVSNLRMLSIKALSATEVSAAYKRHTLIGLLCVVLAALASVIWLHWLALSVSILVYGIASVVVFLLHQNDFAKWEHKNNAPTAQSPLS